MADDKRQMTAVNKKGDKKLHILSDECGRNTNCGKTIGPIGHLTGYVHQLSAHHANMVCKDCGGK